jgi:hypothetical protein
MTHISEFTGQLLSVLVPSISLQDGHLSQVSRTCQTSIRHLRWALATLISWSNGKLQVVAVSDLNLPQGSPSLNTDGSEDAELNLGATRVNYGEESEGVMFGLLVLAHTY